PQSLIFQDQVYRPTAASMGAGRPPSPGSLAPTLQGAGVGLFTPSLRGIVPLRRPSRRNPMTPCRTARLLLAASAAVTLGLAARPARAALITPDSILRPPPAAVGSANLTPITSAADLVNTQYAALGLTFPAAPGTVPGLGPATAITSIGGVAVWAPASRTEA